MSEGDADGGSESEPGLGTLFVCAVPIGNLDDATPRLRATLAQVDAIACEDTRSTRKLLGLLDVEPAPRLLRHDEHSERAGAAGIVALLERGEDVALVSDAGTPAIADPGVPLVRAALDAGCRVVSIPGPSALVAALSVAGARGRHVVFAGFLSRTMNDVRTLAEEYPADVVVAFESPQRIARSVGVIADAQPARRVVVARELTKLHEEIIAGTALEVEQNLLARESIKGEIVLVLDAVALANAGPTTVDAGSIDLVVALVDEGLRMKDAVRVVAEHAEVPARDLYDAAQAARDARG